MTYQTLAKFISWIFKTKDDRRKFRIFCKEIDDKKDQKIVFENYKKVIQDLKNKEKIRVIFINTESAKWQYQSLYEEFKKDQKFEVLVLIGAGKSALKNDFLRYKKSAEDSLKFFKEYKMQTDFLFDFSEKKFKNLKDFNPDIIFYEQPWDLPNEFLPVETSKFALSFYAPYGSCITNGLNEYSESLYRLVYRYFVDNPFIKDILINHGCLEKSVVVSGQLKLDSYLKPVDYDKILWKSKNKRIIWAPHHSFFKNSIMKFGTFDWNYKFMYEFARNNSQIEFILKPHPLLKKTILEQNLMSKKQMQEYFDNWKNLKNTQIYESGNYFDMLKESDLLITDCNSFLYEYLPSLKPCIKLVNKNSVGHNFFGQKITSGYYEAKNLKELENLLNTVFTKDLLSQKREEIIKQYLIQPKGGVAKFIKNHIAKEILS